MKLLVKEDAGCFLSSALYVDSHLTEPDKSRDTWCADNVLRSGHVNIFVMWFSG